MPTKKKVHLRIKQQFIDMIEDGICCRQDIYVGPLTLHKKTDDIGEVTCMNCIINRFINSIDGMWWIIGEHNKLGPYKSREKAVIELKIWCKDLKRL